MGRTCQYPGCDRNLVTGRKYCHVHRSFGKEQPKIISSEAWNGFGEVLSILIITLIFILICWFLYNFIIANWKGIVFTIIIGLIILLLYFKHKKDKNKSDAELFKYA